MSVTVQPTYLLDSNGVIWLVSVSNGGLTALLTPTPGGSPAFTSIFLNDLGAQITWKVTVVPAVGGEILNFDRVTYSPSAPPQLLVNSADGSLWALQFAGGFLQIAVGATSCLPTFPRVGCLFNYDTASGPNGMYPVFAQPGGIGNPTVPAQASGEILGMFIGSCGHSFGQWEIISCAVDGVQSAICRCPLCQYVQRIYTPFESIYSDVNQYIIA